MEPVLETDRQPAMHSRSFELPNETLLEILIGSPAFLSFMDAGRLPRIEKSDSGGILVAHPLQWSACDLYSAASLTLELAVKCLPEGLGLKEAKPANVGSVDGQPMFLNLAALERRSPCDATWVPFDDYVRSFLLPLLVRRYFGWTDAEIASRYPNGLDAPSLYAKCGWLQRFQEPFFSLVTVPTWLMSRKEKQVLWFKSYNGSRMAETPEQARTLLNALFSHLRRTLKRLEPL